MALPSAGNHEEPDVQVRSPIWGRRNPVAVSTVNPAGTVLMKDVLIQVGHVACDVLVGCCLAAATLVAVDLVMPKPAADASAVGDSAILLRV